MVGYPSKTHLEASLHVLEKDYPGMVLAAWYKNAERLSTLRVTMPQLLDNPDWSAVIELAQEYMEDLNDPDMTSDELHKYEAYMFEAVLEALYGKSVFDEINAILIK